MDIKIDYSPNSWQSLYHSSPARHKCCAGAMGCLPAGSKVLTSQGFVEIQDITSPTTLLSLSQDKIGFALSSRSYQTGIKELYRVVHEHGEFLAPLSHKLFFSSGKYLPLADYLQSYKDEAFVFLPDSTLESFQKEYEINAPHLLKKVLDYLDDCLVYSHQYGPLPQHHKAICQALAPSLIGANTPFQSFDQKTQQELEPLHIHLDQSILRLSNLGLQVPLEDQQALILNQALHASYEHTSQDNQPNPLSLLHTMRRHLNELFHQHYISTLGVHTVHSKILSIEYSHNEMTYDLHVLGTNNYISNNLINHNSGKTTAAVAEHLTLAIENPGSLWLVGRKTLPSLKDTILRSFLQFVPEELIADFNKSHLNMKLVNGSEFIFRPLDDPEKLKSLEISGFIIEEANEIEKEIYDRLKDRMRQKIKGKIPRYQSTILLNPGDEDHWIPQLFMFNPPPGHKIFQSTTIDNMENLPPEYISELENTYSPDMLQRLLYGQFGKIHKGKPVFPMFKPNEHVYSLEFNPKLPLIRGWDFGFNRPVCVWMQMERGQVRILGEALGQKIYLDDFINGRADPYYKGVLHMQEELFGRVDSTMDFCDPRGSDESDKGTSSVKILNDNKIFPAFRRTSIQEGIVVMKSLMETIDPVNKMPNLLVHRRASRLVDALKGGYHRGDDDDPVKDNYYDDVVDATRYGIIHICQRARINRAMREQNDYTTFVSRHTGYRRESIQQPIRKEWYDEL